VAAVAASAVRTKGRRSLARRPLARSLSTASLRFPYLAAPYACGSCPRTPIRASLAEELAEELAAAGKRAAAEAAGVAGVARGAAWPRVGKELEEAEGKTASIRRGRQGRAVSALALPADARARRETKVESAAAAPEPPACRRPTAAMTLGQALHGLEYEPPRGGGRRLLGVPSGDSLSRAAGELHAAL
jgi:hypothetical protein